MGENGKGRGRVGLVGHDEVFRKDRGRVFQVSAEALPIGNRMTLTVPSGSAAEALEVTQQNSWELGASVRDALWRGWGGALPVRRPYPQALAAHEAHPHTGCRLPKAPSPGGIGGGM